MRVVRRMSGWYAMLTLKLEVDIPEPCPHGEPLGIDLGLEKFLATSNGKLVVRPRCQTVTGRKELSERVHSCPECGYRTDRDVAAAQVVAQRGVRAVGHTVQASGGIGLRRSRLMEESHDFSDSPVVGVSKIIH